MRRFIQDNIRMLLDEFRIDGFRWDSPQNILGFNWNMNSANPDNVLADGKSMMMAINRMIHEQYPARWSIAEDSDLLSVVPNGHYGFNTFHDQLRVGSQADSFDGHWQTSFHDIITPQVASSSPNVGAILSKVNGWSEPPGYRVIFTDNHDKSGNLNNASRLANRMDPANPSGHTARKKALLNAVLTLTSPGTPMLWMGQEFQATGPFNDGVPLDWHTAFTQHRVFRAHRDLVILRETLPALQNSDLSEAPGGLNQNLGLMVYFRRANGLAMNDVVVFMNFSGQTHNNVSVQFPSSGTWYVRMNTDWPVYGTDFSNIGPGGIIIVGGTHRAELSIGPHSAIILARTPAPAGVAVDDADGNGLPDGWEAMTGLTDPDGDEDGDGITNLAEFRRGSNPLVPDRMALVGGTGPLAWNPDAPAARMTWSDARQRWEWSGTFGAGSLDFKFATGPGWSGSNYGTGAGVPLFRASTGGPSNITVSLTAGRYRFSFNEFTGVYAVESFPVATEWRELHDLPPDVPWSADSDGDGVEDAVEYALGGDPRNPLDGDSLKSVSFNEPGNPGGLVMRWLQRTNDDGGLVVTPQVSSSLLGESSWTAVASSPSPDVSNVPPGFQRRQVVLPIEGEARFLRLRVSGP